MEQPLEWIYDIYRYFNLRDGIEDNGFDYRTIDDDYTEEFTYEDVDTFEM